MKLKMKYFLCLYLFLLASCSNHLVSNSERSPAGLNTCQESFTKFFIQKDQFNMAKFNFQNKVKTIMSSEEIIEILKSHPGEESDVRESIERIIKKYPDFSSYQIKAHYKLLERYCGI